MIRLYLALFTLLMLHSNVQAQIQLVSDPVSVMQIPGITAMEASATHLYVLSESEGLVVFRTNSDTLQWIFTSEGMQERGNELTADIRFAYQYGNGTRLTVLEPTSVLGVFSSTSLPDRPRAVARVGTTLYVAMGNTGLGALSLNSPSLFDSEPKLIPLPDSGSPVNDIVKLPLKIIVLQGSRHLTFFNIDGDDLAFDVQLELEENVRRLHVVNQTLFASDSAGNLSIVRSDGSLDRVFRLPGSIQKVNQWNDRLLVRTVAGHLYLYERNSDPIAIRSDVNAGNFFSIANNQLWLSNFNELSRQRVVQSRSAGSRSATEAFRIQSIEPVIVPFPRPVLVPLRVSGAQIQDVRFQVRNEIPGVEIRGNGFYWQPQIHQTGIHRFTVLAFSSDGRSDSTSFTVDIRPFNAPPRFNPVRPITIAVDEHFTLPVRAVDPDGTDPELIRYHGVDLPNGATISERTGMFTWTPDRRQVGTHTFRVIATDQFGAASSLEVSITVRNMHQE